jgi:hypothetical protein
MLSLDGKRIEVRGESCSGWEEGRLTSDGERLLVNAEITCGTDPKQLRTTAFTIAPSGSSTPDDGLGALAGRDDAVAHLRARGVLRGDPARDA